MAPFVETVLRGYSMTSNEGNFALCGVYLVTVTAPGGDTVRIVYDAGHVGRRLKLQNALRRRGILPSEADILVLSHGHWDHVQNADMFSGGQVLLHESELRYLEAPHPGDHATPGWTRAILDSLRVRGTGDGDELAPGVKVVHLPGHTPGSIGLTVQTDDGVAVLTGDAIATGGDAAAERCPTVFWSAEQADASIRRARNLGEIFYPGHDRPFRLGEDGQARYVQEVRAVTLSVPVVREIELHLAAQDRSHRNLVGAASEADGSHEVSE